jgi:hypothetical protein
LRTAGGEASSADANVIIDASGAGEEDIASPAGKPNIFRLGSKADGDDITFAQGLGQIRELFATLADRAALNLYA